MRNASISGAFIRAADRLPLWARLDVEVLLPGTPGRLAEHVPAHVTRTTTGGVGIEWHDLAPGPVRRLLATLAPVEAPDPRTSELQGIGPTIEEVVEAPPGAYLESASTCMRR